MKREPLKYQVYDNIKYYSKEGKLLFLSSIRKLKFYQKKGLVQHIEDDKYTLLFTPRFLSPPEVLIPRQNCCVVTGSTKNLTKHHIIPSFFRKHFPPELKLNFQYVVLIDGDKHAQYTIEEQKMYVKLGEVYNIEKRQDLILMFENKVHHIKLARTLLNHGAKIPCEKRKYLEQQFIELTGLKLSNENLKKMSNENSSVSNTEYDFGKQLVSKIDDFEAFEMLWLHHFIDVMKPKYLPEDLKQKLI